MAIQIPMGMGSFAGRNKACTSCMMDSSSFDAYHCLCQDVIGTAVIGMTAILFNIMRLAMWLLPNYI